jgi:hypothetical protein
MSCLRMEIGEYIPILMVYFEDHTDLFSARRLLRRNTTISVAA